MGSSSLSIKAVFSFWPKTSSAPYTTKIKHKINFTMNIQTFELWARYHIWATDRFATSLRAISDEDFVKIVVSSSRVFWVR